MKVIYEAVIPQQPNDTNFPQCPLGPQNYIPCAQATLKAVIQEVTPAVFNKIQSFLFLRVMKIIVMRVIKLLHAQEPQILII